MGGRLTLEVVRGMVLGWREWGGNGRLLRRFARKGKGKEEKTSITELQRERMNPCVHEQLNMRKHKMAFDGSGLHSYVTHVENVHRSFTNRSTTAPAIREIP